MAFLLARRMEESVSWQSMTGSLVHGVAASLTFVVSFLAMASLVKLFSWDKLRLAFAGKGGHKPWII